MSAPIRVLVVDDSAFARKVIREALSASPQIAVVDIARDGLEALEKIAALRPDVVTLDLMMPNLDGIGVLRALLPGAPRVIVVSTAHVDTDLAIEALQLGAVDLVHKPTAQASDRLYALSHDLVRKVIAAASARVHPHPLPPAAPAPAAPASVSHGTEVIAIGTSTGGPQALSRLLAALPGNLPVPVVVALHIPPGYTETFARRLDGTCALHVVEGSDRLPLRPGLAVVAPGGWHLRVAREGSVDVARLDLSPAHTAHHPSVDVLFESVAALHGRAVLAVVLTGMGDDGLAGARAIHRAGGRVLAEAESSCVVYGMPRVVAEAGLTIAQVPLEEMAATIVRHL